MAADGRRHPPRQPAGFAVDSSNCGGFVCAYACALLAGRDPRTVTIAEMRTVRQRALLDVMMLGRGDGPRSAAEVAADPLYQAVTARFLSGAQQAAEERRPAPQIELDEGAQLADDVAPNSAAPFSRFTCTWPGCHFTFGVAQRVSAPLQCGAPGRPLALPSLPGVLPLPLPLGAALRRAARAPSALPLLALPARLSAQLSAAAARGAAARSGGRGRPAVPALRLHECYTSNMKRHQRAKGHDG